jgi:hypothetical protein
MDYSCNRDQDSGGNAARGARADDLFLFILEAFGEDVGMAFEFARRESGTQTRIHVDVRASGKLSGDGGRGNTRFLRDFMESGLCMIHRDEGERFVCGPFDRCFFESERLRYRTRKITYKKIFSLSTVFFFVYSTETGQEVPVWVV